MKQNEHEPFFSNKPTYKHLLMSSIQYQYSQTIVIVSTVTAQLSLLGCLPLILLTAQNGLVFIQIEAFNYKHNELVDAF